MFKIKYIGGRGWGGYFLENDFGSPPPPINFVHRSHDVLHENYWSCGRSCTKLIRGGPNFIIQKESSLVFRYKDIL